MKHNEIASIFKTSENEDFPTFNKKQFFKQENTIITGAKLYFDDTYKKKYIAFSMEIDILIQCKVNKTLNLPVDYSK